MLRLILTCEHGGNTIPAAYQDLFTHEEELLQSHRGYDPGALELFGHLQELADKSFSATTSRLLVELNRSPGHKDVFSEITRPLPEQEKEKLLRQYYIPYREQVEGLIHDFVMAGRRVLHIAVHTFTPELDGEKREADIGLLYDPKREGEKTFSRAWKKMLQEQDEKLLVRYNYPYLGISDGFPTYLRRKFADGQYMGIELEVNQKFLQGPPERWEQVLQALKQSLAQLMLIHRKTRNGEAGT
ncbi:N-formylglutamate amidohydrolase [Pontibacter actiniarum]|uniref:N-formylglutamate amidohydrolase n=1 Tax=Pontibacter actiniarum TaxID=323450 RepID=A0A1X9YQB5_9BACT|nr:N-formylglutamate amidohydrolase [Pontibacter actiniarum]ARS35065.1 N-formylglutamate amidohydrolase [Pontibacter actiniarum]